MLVALGTTDVLFALDSIPAVFGVTREAFIVFCANAFALLGLRALFFLVSGLLDRLVFLSAGLALILVFIGIKMILEPLVHLPVALSLGVIVVLIAGSIVLSWRRTAGGTPTPA